MKEFLYVVTAYDAEGELIRNTNSVRTAIKSALEWAESGVQVDIINGLTGEVLYIANPADGDPYCEDEFGLTLLGYFMEKVWG